MMDFLSGWHKTVLGWIKIYWPSAIGPEIIASTLLGVFVLLSLGLHKRFVALTHTQEIQTQKQLRHIAFRNRMAFLYLVLLFFIWAGEIRSLLLSVAAVAAALLLVSKELIANILGGLVFTFAKPAEIGHIVRLPSGITGRLIDVSWFYLTVQEVNEHQSPTGKTLRVPNNFLLTGHLSVLSQNTQSIQTHHIKVPTHLAYSAQQFLATHLQSLFPDRTLNPSAPTPLPSLLEHLDQLHGSWALHLASHDHQTVDFCIQFYATGNQDDSIWQNIVLSFYQWQEEQLKNKVSGVSDTKAPAPAPSAPPTLGSVF